MQKKSTPLVAIVLLVLVILAGYALRLYKLGDMAVWYDEAYGAVLVRNDPATLTTITSYDVHPPLYYYCLWAWRNLTGESEFALRYLSIIAGILTLPLLYQFGKRLLDWRAGVVAALLLAVSRFHVWWSQEIRMYTLATLLGVAGLLALLRLIVYLDGPRDALRADRWTPLRLWLGYVLAGTAALYTVYLSALPLLAANALIAAGIVLRFAGIIRRGGKPDPDMQPRWPLRRTLLWWASAQLVILACFVPWMLYVAGRAPNWGSASQLDFGFFLEVYMTALALGISTDIGSYLIPALFVFGVVVLALVLAAMPQRSKPQSVTLRLGILLLLLCLVVPAGLVYLLTTIPRDRFYVPPFSVRYTVLTVPYFCALLGAGVALLMRLRTGRFVAPLLAIALTLIGASALPDYYAPRYYSDDYWSLVRTINANAHPNDIIILYTEEDWPDFMYAYGHLGGTLPRVDINRGEPVQADKIAALLSGLVQDQKHDGIWLVRRNARGVDPQGLTEQWLEKNMHKVAEYGYTAKELLYFTTVPTRDLFTTTTNTSAIEHPYPPPNTANAAGTIGIAQPPYLIGYDLPVHEYRNGDALTIALYWSTRGQPVPFDHHLDVRVQLLDSAGKAVHAEAGILWAAALARENNTAIARIPYTFWAGKQIPPGTYSIEVTVATQADAEPEHLRLPETITVR